MHLLHLKALLVRAVYLHHRIIVCRNSSSLLTYNYRITKAIWPPNCGYPSMLMPQYLLPCHHIVFETRNLHVIKSHYPSYQDIIFRAALLVYEEFILVFEYKCGTDISNI